VKKPSNRSFGLVFILRHIPADTAPALKHNTVEAIINYLTGDRLNGLTFEVHESESTFPDEIKKSANEQGATNQVNTVYIEDKVHIIASQMKSKVNV
jgi:hypothetical protein